MKRHFLHIVFSLLLAVLASDYLCVVTWLDQEQVVLELDAEQQDKKFEEKEGDKDFFFEGFSPNSSFLLTAAQSNQRLRFSWLQEADFTDAFLPKSCFIRLGLLYGNLKIDC